MLPPGHIAAGYLTSKALLEILPYKLSLAEQNKILLWGMFFAFAPDLDVLYSFIKAKTLKNTIMRGESHRKYASHVPWIWLIVGLIIFFASAGNFGKVFGLTLWLASWSHFLFDTIFHYGLMWAWPFSKKIHALFQPKQMVAFEKVMATDDKENFFRYWLDFIWRYQKTFTISFCLEIIMITAAILIHLKLT